jgi:alkanesulfonate monooxygenase SsuD/methylene tetrahydromethanopterin reductase-like flavin-dependent oxidoreductase (luciferase family)
MPQINFGIFPITEDWPDGADMVSVYNEIIGEAKAAESAGFDSCLITEHHQQADGYFPNPLMVSAGVARETTTLKVGTCVALAPLYNPIRLTEDTALLDVISGGRLVLGLGASYVSEDLAAFGVDAKQRGALMEDTTRFLTEAWTRDNLDFDGEVYHFKNMRVTPKPVQKPRPPLWLGAWTPGGLRRAGRLGDAWVTDVINTLPTLKSFAQIYRQAAEKHGNPSSIAVLRECWIAPSTEQALEEYAENVMTSHRFYFQAGGYSPLADPWIAELNSIDEFTYEKVAADRFIVGSPEHCISEIERWHEELGCDYFVLRFRHPAGPDHGKALASMKLFGETVIPHFA